MDNIKISCNLFGRFKCNRDKHFFHSQRYRLLVDHYNILIQCYLLRGFNILNERRTTTTSRKFTLSSVE